MGCSQHWKGVELMDPITLIVAALAAGAAAGAGDAASQAIKDAYAGLKALLKRRFAGNAEAEKTLADHAADPETNEKPLAEQLEAAGAQDDAQIVRAAEELLKQADEAGIKTKYQVRVSGGKVGIIGDHGHIDTMN
jgi:hypothetical protein